MVMFMVYVDVKVCTGCGECVEVCQTGALIFQNNCAYIDQKLCQGCEICVEACPINAIISEEVVFENRDVIRIPEKAPAQFIPIGERSELPSARDMILPAVGSLMMWTGRELLPRLADLALGYLDQQIRSSQHATIQNPQMPDRGLDSGLQKRNGQGWRRRRHRRKRKFI